MEASVHGLIPRDDGVDLAAGEELPVERTVIDGDDPVSFELQNPVSKLGHLLPVPTVIRGAFAIEVRRIHEEKRRG